MSERYVDPALNMPRVAPPDAPRDEPRAANTARAEEDTDFELWLIYKSLTENESYDQKISIKDDVFSGRTILSFLGFAAVITFAAVGWSGWNQMAEGQVHSRSLEVKNWQRSNCNGHSNDLVEPGLHSLVIKERLPNSGPTIFGPVRIFDGFRIKFRTGTFGYLKSGPDIYVFFWKNGLSTGIGPTNHGPEIWPTNRLPDRSRFSEWLEYGFSDCQYLRPSQIAPPVPWTLGLNLKRAKKHGKRLAGLRRKEAGARSKFNFSTEPFEWRLLLSGDQYSP